MSPVQKNITPLNNRVLWWYGYTIHVPTNTVQVPITTGTVTDSGSVNTCLLGALSRGQVNCERWPVDRPLGWNAGLTDPGPMCMGGGGEVQVMNVESRGQSDAATCQIFSYCFQMSYFRLEKSIRKLIKAK